MGALPPPGPESPAVPGASVVVTNPTHYAVALKYEMGAAGAPKVVAKGADLIAQKILRDTGPACNLAFTEEEVRKVVGK